MPIMEGGGVRGSLGGPKAHWAHWGSARLIERPQGNGAAGAEACKDVMVRHLLPALQSGLAASQGWRSSHSCRPPGLEARASKGSATQRGCGSAGFRARMALIPFFAHTRGM